ncbi:MAG: hypothetical protein IPL40_04300 [Proteobacteria bacterium]|nr:hypothetical protein [Pseudomonadota bacterium]
MRGLGASVAQRIVDERGHRGPYRSISELAARCALARPQLVSLALAGALRGLQPERRRAIWEATALGGNDLVANLELGEAAVAFAPLPAALELELDYAHAASFVEGHPLQLHRSWLRQRGVLASAELEAQRPGSNVAVAGLVVVRQRPGNGRMIFMALEDETGLVDIAVPLALFERQRTLILLSGLLLVRGRLQLDGAARAVLAQRFERFGDDAVPARARDFH